MDKNMKETGIGDIIELSREQWGKAKANISNYPGLLDEVKKHTWSCSGGKHPYLKSSTLKTTLHRFVLDFLYGKENLDRILAEGNIIEHLDNNGINCAYDNLHIISADYNKAKAFTIDKLNECQGIPTFVVDVYYSHRKGYYQMQISFNRDVYFFANKEKYIYVESFFVQYKDFQRLFMDWLYVLNCRESGFFEVRKLRADYIYAAIRPIIDLRPEEKDKIILQREGKYYLRLNPDGGDKVTYISKTAYRNLENICAGYKKEENNE